MRTTSDWPRRRWRSTAVGTWCVGGATEILEGTWIPHRLVILEFANRDQAKRWVDSVDYQPARALRRRSARSNLIVVDGTA